MSKNKYYRKLINSQTWIKLRLTKLANNPLCENCYSKGKIAPASEVHHVIPVENGINYDNMKRLCYDYNNLQSLCRDCHVAAHVALKSKTKAATQRINDQKTAFFVAKFLKK